MPQIAAINECLAVNLPGHCAAMAAMHSSPASPGSDESGDAGLRSAASRRDRRRDRRRDQPGFDRKNTGHGMLEAGRFASRWKVAWRHVLVKLIGKLPGTQLKSRLIRRWLGVRMGENVGLAYGVYLDPYDPAMISIGDNVIIGFESKIFVHAFTLNRQRLRLVTIGSNVMIGGFCVIAPGVTIGDGASIAPGTIVSRDVPAGAIVTGNEMRIRKRGGERAPKSGQ